MSIHDAHQPRLYALSFEGKLSRTQQHFKEECDIHTIVDRYKRTNQLPMPTHMGTYGDFSDINDYQSARLRLIEADELFMEFPAEIRTRKFHNDPAEFIAFVQDPDNQAEAIELGLCEPQDLPLGEPIHTPQGGEAPTPEPTTPPGGETPPSTPTS